jgi:hypothetical protein
MHAGRPGLFDPADPRVGQALADVATIALLRAYASSWALETVMRAAPAVPPGGAGPEQQLLRCRHPRVGWWGHYLLSASTRRSMSSWMLPVLGRSRLASRSLSWALDRPS